MSPDVEGQDGTERSTIVSRLKDKVVKPAPTPETPEDTALYKVNEEVVMQAVEDHLNATSSQVANESSSSTSSVVRA